MSLFKFDGNSHFLVGQLSGHKLVFKRKLTTSLTDYIYYPFILPLLTIRLFHRQFVSHILSALMGVKLIYRKNKSSML